MQAVNYLRERGWDINPPSIHEVLVYLIGIVLVIIHFGYIQYLALDLLIKEMK